MPEFSTKRRSRLTAAFRKRLRALRREREGVVSGDVEALHRMRVASRRVREALAVLTLAGSDPADEAGVRRLRRRVRRLTRALGGVRELDVARANLDELVEKFPALEGGTELVRAIVEPERGVRRAEALRRIEAADLKVLLRKIMDQVVAFDLVADEEHRYVPLGARIARRADRLEAAVEAAGTMYAADRLHAVRIATKKLRYALELAKELARVPTLALTRRLKTMQDLLGRLHDLEVLAGYARSAEAAADVSEDRRAAIGEFRAVVEEEILRLHADYLRQRKVLVTVVARVRGEVCPRLAHQAPAPLRVVVSA